MAAMRNLIIGCVLLGASCGDGPDLGSRIPSEGGVGLPLPDADEVGDGGEPCPESEPKIGDRCPGAFAEGNSCSYPVDTCPAPTGGTYTDYVIYCCFQTLWAACGEMSPCQSQDSATLDVPRSPPLDAAVDATPDGVIDGAIPDGPAPDGAASDGGADAGAPD
jgi:hypothetical protein